MEISGNIKYIGPLVSGVSKATGKQWQKREFVVEDFSDRYPDSAAITAFGDKVSELDSFALEQPVTVTFDITARQYQKPDGTTAVFNNLNMYKIQPYMAQGPQPQGGYQQAQQPVQQQPVQQYYQQPVQQMQQPMQGQAQNGNLPF